MAWNINCHGGGCDVGKALGNFSLTAFDLSGLGMLGRAKALATPLIEETGQLFAREVAEESLEDIGQTVIRNAVDDVPAQVSVHGNSSASTRAQHVYEIVENETNTVRKTGISGGKISKTGNSYRATRQVNKLNKAAGNGKYRGEIKARIPAGPGARSKALRIERANAALHRATLDPMIHKRP